MRAPTQSMTANSTRISSISRLCDSAILPNRPHRPRDLYRVRWGGAGDRQRRRPGRDRQDSRAPGRAPCAGRPAATPRAAGTAGAGGLTAPEPERSRREARGASKEARQGPGRAGDLAAAGRKRGQPTPKRAGVPVGQGGGGGAGMRIYRCGLPATGARPGRKEARFAVACAAEAVYAAYTSGTA